MHSSNLISLAISMFFVLIIFEYCYGMLSGKNTYRINDAISSISLGLISRLSPILHLGFKGAVFSYAANTLNLKLLPIESWITWVIAFILYDLIYYWMHRKHHEIKLLWATHVVHHQSEDFNLSTALRQTGTGFLWKWIFFVPMLVIGIPPEAFITVAALNLIYQFWVHTEHIGKLNLLEMIFVTPSNHRVHHAQNKEYIDANYGGVFIVWDRIFGTFIEENTETIIIYGTVKPLKSWNPLWANLEIFFQMIRDTIYTKTIRDKLRIWYSNTKWRPQDVALRFPAKLNDLKQFEKYDPTLSTYNKTFSLFQFLSINLIFLSILLTLSSQAYEETIFFSIIIIASTTITTILLENIKGYYLIEMSRSIIILLVVFLTDLINQDLITTQLVILHAVVNILLISVTLSTKRNSFLFKPHQP